MNTAQWHQEIVVKPIDEIVTNTTCPNPPPPPAAAVDQRKPRPLKEQALNCPRCNSTNTKFCYYNNYSLTQPRYFCKTCRRYWTEGGSLRNIPVGGGSRKNKRSAPSSTSSTSKRLPDLVTPPSLSQSSAHNPKIHEGHDLNLGFSSTQDLNCISQLVQFPTKNSTYPTSCSPNNSASQLSSLELISGISSRGFASFMSMPDPNGTVYSSGFPMQEFKPTLNFSLDGLGTSGYGHDSLQGVQEGTSTTTSSGGRLLFPFDDSKHVAPNTAAQAQEAEQSKVQGDSAGYWTGMLGGAGSSW